MDNDENKALYFPKGLPGFEDEHTFILKAEQGTPLAQLDSVENKEIGFVLLRSQLFFPEYLVQVDLPSEEAALIEANSEDCIDVWSIMTLSISDMSQSTVNLRAPLLINPRTQKGIQIILDDEGYSSRQPIFSDSAKPQSESTKEGAVG